MPGMPEFFVVRPMVESEHGKSKEVSVGSKCVVVPG